MAAELDAAVVGATVVSHRGVAQLDIGLRDGRIAEIASSGSLAGAAPAERVLNARGLHVLPGVIDSHVHFREPGGEHSEDFESGSRGAVLGGVTTVFDMPNTSPYVLDAVTLADKLDRIARRSWCDYALYVGTDGRNVDDLPSLERLPGVCGVKLFMSSSTADLMVTRTEAIAAVMRAGRRRIAIHAEDEARIRARRHIAERAGDVRAHGEWRDVESAVSATRLAIALAREASRPIHILHVSTAEELALIAENKDLVSCEALPQHLHFAAPGCYERFGALCQQNPPIREAPHRDALWRALAAGVVDTIGSDHGPHTLTEKALPYPSRHSGMPGTQTLVPLMMNAVANGRLSLHQAVDLLSAGPARIFGIRGKGRIAVGYDADLTLVDLGARRRIENAWIASKVGWTAYDGMEVTGWPEATIVRGEAVMRDGALCGRPVGRPARFDQEIGGTPEDERT